MLEILYQDAHYVAINKPHNLLVHRSPIAADVSVFALQLLRDQLGAWVSPCHRIDRKTSGVLMFALSATADQLLKRQFELQLCSKKYLTLVRGFVPEEGFSNRPLDNEKGVMKTAETHFKKIRHFEIPIEVSRYPHSRYSLVEVSPKTGRMHQIRRHFAQLRHYLIGDKIYGECKHNKMFQEVFGLDTMLLHAQELSFMHPFDNKMITITAPFSDTFERILQKLDELDLEKQKNTDLS